MRIFAAVERAGVGRDLAPILENAECGFAFAASIASAASLGDMVEIYGGF